MLLVREVWRASLSEVVDLFFEGSWADLADYLDGLRASGHVEAAGSIETAATGLPHTETYATAVLSFMPDGDFLTALENILAGYHDQALYLVEDSVNQICQRRGVPYRLAESGRVFEWVGDPLTETEVLAPALSALDDPRLSGGPHDEFIAARAAIREGTPQSYRRAVAEACNAVESGLKVLLTEHGVALPNQQHVDALLTTCRDAGIFPPAVSQPGVPAEQIITGPARFGNRRGRHGAGPVPHDVEPDEAEAVVASAAVALTLIARRLP